ncbi:60S ribosomal protein L24 [Aspergillus hancockii]|nr:60S ribosomal protein L24 [Aspergillus hancockii]
METGSQPAAPKQHSPKNKSPQTKDQDTKKKNLQEQVEYIRSITGTEVKTISPTDFKHPRRADDNVRQWNTVNLRCTTCQGDCPVCGVPCCKYEAARRIFANADSNSNEAGNAEQVIQIIESLEFHVKDMMSREQLAAATDSTQPPHRQPTTSRCASPTFKMRTYDDSFSGQKIYPGKGKLYVRGDSKIFRFQNGKSESLFLQRKNPRRISWTVLYRRQHKKGISEEVAKKRTRRAVKSQRAIVGASLDVIKERRNQRPEARAAARQQAIKDAKEKKAASEKAKKAEKAKTAAKPAGQRIQSKQGAKGSAPKVAAKSR